MSILKGVWNGLLIVVGLTAIGCILARFVVDPYVSWIEPIAAEYGTEVALLITLMIAVTMLIIILTATRLLGWKRR